MKHNWERDENGNIDEWAWESGFHNGVFCVDCGKAVCVNCNPDYMELDDCIGPQKPDADEISKVPTLQAENAQLRGELEYEREHANAYYEECGQWEAETAQLRKERDAAVSDIEAIMAYAGNNTCQYCKNGQCQKRGGTKLCYPVWRGPKED